MPLLNSFRTQFIEHSKSDKGSLGQHVEFPNAIIPNAIIQGRIRDAEYTFLFCFSPIADPH